ncbi:MAG: phosphate ABC transporter substrate-binding/OmpA family protein [Planctomycetota bacterium]
MAKTSGAKWVTIAAVWIAVVVVIALAYRFIVHPQFAKAAAYDEAQSAYVDVVEQAEARGESVERLPGDATIEEYRNATAALKRRLTGSASPSRGGERIDVRLALDSFSGYAVLRDPTFQADLAAAGIDLELVDDAADYEKRLRTLDNGDTPMAVFTVDALLTTAADLGRMPATIVMVIDETVGADAMVAYTDAVPDLDALAGGQIVLTPASPSETLARVVQASFDIEGVDIVPADGADDVLSRLRSADRSTRQAFVLWEPQLSRALEVDGVGVLLDSGDFQGYIVDVLVVNRDWLLRNEAVVTEFVRAYQRALYDARSSGLAGLIGRDAERTGTRITDAQADRIADGIRFQPMLANYAYFGVEPDPAVPTLDTVIRQLNRVLQRTGALDGDPTDGDPAAWYYDGVLAKLRVDDFHPGVTRDGIDRREVAELSEAQWQQLRSVGTLQVDRLVFFPGRSDLTGSSKAALDRLAETLRSFPQFYVRVVGSASSRGDTEANRRLADARAENAAEYLRAAGLEPQRVRAIGTEPSGDTSRTVRFEVGVVGY